jgi:methylated-DNA-[protein]-cysteine S-methyltransferase
MNEIILRAPLCVSLSWEQSVLSKIDLSWSKENHLSQNPRSDYGRRFAVALEQYLDGQPVSWPETKLSLEHCSEFTRTVLTVLRKNVGWGQWLSYGELAGLCRAPKAARAVGLVMSRNPWPLLVPCHRVLGSKGALTGFGPGLEMKAYLLKLEGNWPLAGGMEKSG